MPDGLKAWLARQAYIFLLRAGLPFYLLRVWRRGRQEPGYVHAWPQRLAWFDAAWRRALSAQPFAERPLVWLHAVSLGETRAAAPLVQALRMALPGMRLLLTHTTATGRDAGQALLQPGDLQTWLPYDTPGATRRFLKLHRPVLGVLMETEVWPVILHQAACLGVPVVLANARLSAKSLRQGQRFSALLKPAAKSLKLVLAQTPSDAERLREMGAAAVDVAGNVKFDMTPHPAILALGREWRRASERPLVLAASTREGEEAVLLSAWLAGSPAHARLLLVPRHPQRFDEVAALCQANGLKVSRRQTWPGGVPDQDALAADVWLGDSMGEMAAYYAAADVAMLGGSFAPLGGQNLIEAAACSCPLVMGPSTFNFAEAAELSLAAGASLRAKDWAEAIQLVSSLLGTDQCEEMRRAALSFALSHQGAAERMATAMVGCIKR